MTYIMDKVYDNIHAKNTADTEEDGEGRNTIQIGRKSTVNKNGGGNGGGTGMGDCKCMK